MVEDRYLNINNVQNRLLEEIKKYNSLFIAFDFDNTVFDYHKKGDIYPRIEKVLIAAKRQGHKLILFTANEGIDLENAIKYCKDRGYEPDLVNENPIMKTRKPLYNILLDDRAGLLESYLILKNILNV